MEKQCEHFKKCGNLAEYELTLTENGRAIHVCGKCDEDYSTCNVCGNAGIYDSGYGDMTYWHSTDEWPTCTICIEQKLVELKVEMESMLETHIASIMPNCNKEIPSWFKQVIISDAAAIWQEENHPCKTYCITTAFEYVLAELITKGGIGSGGRNETNQ